MKVTKYEHSCLDIEDGSNRLVIDPGVLSTSLTDLNSISVIVITHVHSDHFDEQKVRDIVKLNSSVRIFSTKEVADKLRTVEVTVPETEKVYKVGDTQLEFFGGLHAVVLPELPQAQNYGVLVNDKLYYTGDSFSECPRPHIVLAVTAMAPWMKISEAADFIKLDSAAKIIPAHNGFMTNFGLSVVNGLLGPVSESAGKKYMALEPGDSAEV